MKQIESEIVKVATNFIGQQEIRGNRGFKDKMFDLKMRAVGFLTGQPWCSYFTELVWKEALTNNNDYKKYLPKLNSLFSGSVVKTYQNFKLFGGDWCTISDVPTPGCLVCWRSNSNPALGHIGLCVEVLSNNKIVTIEGNTADEKAINREGYIVAKKIRTIPTKGFKLMGYISIK